MTVAEWKTIGLFGVTLLGISLVSPRIAYYAVMGIGAAVLVSNGSALRQKFYPSGGST